MSEQPVTQPQPAPQVQSPAPAPATPTPAPAAAPAAPANPAPAQDEAWRQKYEGLVGFTKQAAPGLFEQYKQVQRSGESPAPAAQVTPQATVTPAAPQPKGLFDLSESEFVPALGEKLAPVFRGVIEQALTARDEKREFAREKQDVAVHLHRALSDAKLAPNDPVVVETMTELQQLGIDVERRGGPSMFAQLFVPYLQKNIMAKMIASGSANTSQQTAAQQAAANQVAQPAGPSAPSSAPMDETQKLIAAMQAQSSVNQRIFQED